MHGLLVALLLAVAPASPEPVHSTVPAAGGAQAVSPASKDKDSLQVDLVPSAKATVAGAVTWAGMVGWGAVLGILFWDLLPDRVQPSKPKPVPGFLFPQAAVFAYSALLGVAVMMPMAVAAALAVDAVGWFLLARKAQHGRGYWDVVAYAVALPGLVVTLALSAMMSAGLMVAARVTQDKLAQSPARLWGTALMGASVAMVVLVPLCAAAAMFTRAALWSAFAADTSEPAAPPVAAPRH